MTNEKRLELIEAIEAAISSSGVGKMQALAALQFLSSRYLADLEMLVMLQASKEDGVN